MRLFTNGQAAAIAALGVESLIHPLDTLITRFQAPGFSLTYQNTHGSLQPALFRGLYNGIAPTLVTTVPASIAFFSIYEWAKPAFEQALGGEKPNATSRAVAHAASSAVAELVACAIINPAEVLKQNAQVAISTGSDIRLIPVFTILKKCARNPRKMWTGYTALLASRLPSTSLTLSLYENLKGRWAQEIGPSADVLDQVKRSFCAAGAAGGLVSVMFVPIDVVKTRMRLAGMDYHRKAHPPSLPVRPILIARKILTTDGLAGLFRGGALTCVAAALSNALYLGCYEGLGMYYAQQRPI